MHFFLFKNHFLANFFFTFCCDELDYPGSIVYLSCYYYFELINSATDLMNSIECIYKLHFKVFAMFPLIWKLETSKVAMQYMCDVPKKYFIQLFGYCATQELIWYIITESWVRVLFWFSYFSPQCKVKSVAGGDTKQGIVKGLQCSKEETSSEEVNIKRSLLQIKFSQKTAATHSSNK